MNALRPFLMVLGLFALSTAAVAEETYRCTINGAKVFQDRPCPGSVRRSDAMPDPEAAKIKAPANEKEDLQAKREKLEQDKKYIDERVKSRNFEREKDNAQYAISRCNVQAAAIVEQITAVAQQSPQGAPVDLASALNLQLDQQRRQTSIQSLQAQHSAKVAQCDQLRESFKEKYGP